MTSFAYSAIGNGDSIAFEPATDVLVIDDASLSAADFILTAQADGAGVQWSLGAQSFTLAGVSLRSLTESNVQFADGSLLVNADVANGYSLSLVGSDLGDLLVGAGAPQTIDLAARTIAGELTNSYSDKPYVSADGRFVLFGANGAALSGDPDISGIEEDLFLRDLLTGTVTRVSEMAAYGQADFTSPLGVYNAAVSSDGRYVAFDSDVDNLVAGDTNGSYDIFLKDLKTGAITLVSSSSTGTQANLDGYTYGPTMSADGRYVAFVSGATNLVEGDTNDSADVFVKDLETGQLTRVSTSSSDVQGDGGFSGRGSTYAKISADGKFVVFESEDRNLVAEDTDGYSDVFVKNLQTGAIRCVSVGQDGLSEPYTSENPDISADGRYVVFESASNLLGDGRDGWGSIYLRDLLTDTLTRVKDAGSYQNALEPKISGDGRFVVFSTAAALVADDTNGVDAEDVYVKDMRTGEVARVSVGADGEQAEGRSLYAEISLDGTTIVFRNDGSPGLSPDDNDGGSSSYVVGNPLYGRTLAGGMGDDVYVISNRKDVIVEAVGEGADTVRAAVAYTLTDNVEDLVLTGSAATDGVGNALDNHITGNGAANTLDGGAGADTMTGRAGDDTYVVDNVGDACQELTGEGFDRVLSSVGITLQSEIENLTLTGSSSLAGHGNALANLLVGNAGANALSGEAGNDTLAGGAGADSLTGGAGNDTYVVDATTDVISEIVTLATEIDTVRSAVTWTLGANLERLSLTGFGAINGTGNTLANSLTGNIGANSLNGGSGNDTLSGDAGNDTLDGSTGADSLIGGIGNDSYYVDSSSDKVTETSTLTTEIDTVVSSISWTLGNYVERLTLSGAAAINGTGNTLANTLVGNTGANSLNGGSGNDTLSGAAGNDTLDGSTGADSLMGGAGNDSYYVDSSSDKVTETSTLATEIDTVVSSISWTLGTYVERLTLSGTAAISGTGNTLANTLTGNGGANSLNGGSGNDTLSGAAGNDILNGGTGVDSLIGGTGNDSYYVDSGSDKVTETSTLATEIDTVVSSISWTLGNYVERLTLAGTAALNGIGNSLGNILTGNTAGNRLDGGGGADTIDGKAGADSMTGGAGADTFAFTTGLASDLITDFTSGSDKLRVSQAAIKVGDGDSAVEGAVAVKGPSGFGSGAELVIVTHDIAGGITASSAAAAIGHASSSYKAGDTRLFVVDNGVDSAAYLFKSADAGATVTSGELTLLATLDNTHATVTSDFLFGA